MKNTILFSRTRVPRPLPGLLPRPALTARLADCLAYPVVLVSAPAGFGKTSLAVECVHHLMAGLLRVPFTEQIPHVAWISIDVEDDDPVRFWSILAASLDRAIESEGLGTPFAGITEATQSLQPPGAFELASNLAEIVESLEIPFILILDDFHLVSAESVMGSLARFIEGSSEYLRLLILSRIDPQLPLARFRVRRLMAEIRVEDLRFDHEDAEKILRGMVGDRLTPSMARTIDAKTEGWGAGLQLAALSLGRRDDPETFVRGFSGSDRFVLEFLAEEVLAAQDEDISKFLLESAVLARFSAKLCDFLFAPAQGSTELIRQIEAANLFLVPLDDECGWYRYHHLFSETLRARLRAIEPGAEADIVCRAAVWFENDGDFETALELLLRAGEKREAARVLERIDYLSQGELATLVSRLEAIGEEVIFERPRLTDLVGWTLVFSGRVAEAEAYMLRALSVIGAFDAKAQDYVRGSFASMRAFIHMLHGEVPEAVEEAKAAELLLDPSDYYPLSIVPFVLGTSLRMEGCFEEATSEFERFERIGLSLGSVWTFSAGRYEMATTAFLMGRLSKASAILEHAIGDAEARGGSRFASIAKLHAVYAEILYERNDLEGATNEIVPMLGPVELSGMAGSIVELYAVWIRVLLASGRVAEAELYLEKAHRVEEGRVVMPRVSASIRELRFRAAALRGYVADGIPFPARSTGTKDIIARGMQEFLEVAQLLAEGNYIAAHKRASALAAEAARDGWGRLLVQAKAAEALSLSGQGKESEAFTALCEAFEAGRPEGFVRSFLDFGQALRLLISRFIKAGPCGERNRAYASRLISAFGEPEPRPRVADGAFVSVREREVLTLLAEGLSNREIAERLFISLSTVKSHFHHVAEKLDAPNRVAILAKARFLGLI